MTFIKLKEHTIRFQNYSGYFLVRSFVYDDKTLNPISDFMKTKYFLWKEEFRDNVPISTNETTDWNFHGLFDIKKLRTEHFRCVTPDEFVKRFVKIFETEIGSDKNIPKAHKCLTELIDEESDFYIIDNLPAMFYHDWTVFNFFLSGFKISRNQKIFTAIECGLD